MIPEQVLKYAGLFLKLFHDGKKSTNFPPLLINNKLESDFKTKANYFNSFFASKFTPLVNSSNTPPRPLLLNCLFNVTEILKIVMQDMAIIYYLLFSRKNNKCSCTLLKINYCDVSRMYLSLGTNKCIYYWCSCHWTFLNNIKNNSPQKFNGNKHTQIFLWFLWNISLWQNITCVWGTKDTKTVVKSIAM